MLKLNRTIFFLALSISMFLLSMLYGLLRLMVIYGVSIGYPFKAYLTHPILAIFGFMASIIITERVAGIGVLKKPTIFTKLINIPVPLFWLGSIFAILAILFNDYLLKTLFISFFLFASLISILFLLYLKRVSRIKLPFSYMILSFIALFFEAIILNYNLPEGNIPNILLILSFPVIFILGERVELISFPTGLKYDKFFKAIFYLLMISLILLITSSFYSTSYYSSSFISILIFISSIIFAFLFLIFFYIENKIYRQISMTNFYMNKYTAKHTRFAYLWGILGYLLCVIYIVSNYNLNLYDPFIHAIAIGYIGNMFLGHGPVIFPTIFRKKIEAKKLRLYPAIILNVAVLFRIIGIISDSFISMVVFKYLIILSGFLIFVAAISLFIMIISSISK